MLIGYQKGVSRGLRFLAFICFSVGLGLPALGECFDVSGFKIPDPDTLNLSNGEHEIAALKTPKGTLSARVRVSGKEISDPAFYFRGKRMRTIPEARVPRAIRACPTPQKESLSQSRLQIAFAGELSDAGTIIEVKNKCIPFVYRSGCDEEYRQCYAQACCRGTDICAWDFESY